MPDWVLPQRIRRDLIPGGGKMGNPLRLVCDIINGLVENFRQ